jgi:four helix bundle protein
MAKTFRDLNVYMMALEASKEVFLMSREWPAVERYALTSQIRRSSRAVSALIAEAWARRRYEGAFTNSINQALGEVYETQAWFDQACECGYIDEGRRNVLDSRWSSIGGMLQRMIDRADEFAPLARGNARR